VYEKQGKRRIKGEGNGRGGNVHGNGREWKERGEEEEERGVPFKKYLDAFLGYTIKCNIMKVNRSFITKTQKGTIKFNNKHKQNDQ